MSHTAHKPSAKATLAGKLRDYIASKGLKQTRQRDVITGIFFSPPHRHYRIEEVLEKSRKQDSSISYATVYRTLLMLCEAGLATQRHFGKGQSLFEQVVDCHHDHLICTDCGTIIEFENDEIENLQEKVARKHGFKLTQHRMELYGLCAKCQK